MISSDVVHSTMLKKPETRKPSSDRLKMTPYRSLSPRMLSRVAYME